MVSLAARPRYQPRPLTIGLTRLLSPFFAVRCRILTTSEDIQSHISPQRVAYASATFQYLHSLCDLSLAATIGQILCASLRLYRDVLAVISHAPFDAWDVTIRLQIYAMNNEDHPALLTHSIPACQFCSCCSRRLTSQRLARYLRLVWHR